VRPKKPVIFISFDSIDIPVKGMNISSAKVDTCFPGTGTSIHGIGISFGEIHLFAYRINTPINEVAISLIGIEITANALDISLNEFTLSKREIDDPLNEIKCSRPVNRYFIQCISDFLS
jgi:hypothetical protein